MLMRRKILITGLIIISLAPAVCAGAINSIPNVDLIRPDSFIPKLIGGAPNVLSETWRGATTAFQIIWLGVKFVWNNLIWSWFKYIWVKTEPVYQQRRQIFKQEFPKDFKALSNDIKTLPEMFKNLWDEIDQWLK